jgi:hypothetical protein
MKVFFAMLSGLFLPQSTQRTQSIDPMVFANSLWYEKIINNELVRTPYELTLPEFVSVRFSSLFFSFSFMNQMFLTDFGVRILRLSIAVLFENHRDLRVHREKWQPSAFSVYSVVDYICNLDRKRIYEAVS